MMMYVVVGVSAAFFISWLTGSALNRKRAAALVRSLQQALPTLGQGASIRWFGAGAFQIDLAQPAAGLTRVQIVGLLEARDLAFVWLFWRIRGRRDRIVIQADFRRPPKSNDTAPPVSSLPNLVSLTLKATSPNLHLVLQVPAGSEGSIANAFNLTRDLAGGKAAAV